MRGCPAMPVSVPDRPQPCRAGDGTGPHRAPPARHVPHAVRRHLAVTGQAR